MDKDNILIFEAYKNTKKTFKELFPIGTQVKYKVSRANYDPDPNVIKQGDGIVIDDKLPYGFGKKEDEYWGMIEIDGNIVEARINELTKIGSKTDYIPNPESLNRIERVGNFLNTKVQELKKKHKIG